jgi:uncharacterized phage protein (TIGR02220 family)
MTKDLEKQIADLEKRVAALETVDPPPSIAPGAKWVVKAVTPGQALEAINAVGFKFRLVESNLKFIRSRLEEGATVDELIDVARLKLHQWKNDSAMRKYLRVETLYNATKFQSYLAEVEAAREREKALVDVFGE